MLDKSENLKNLVAAGQGGMAALVWSAANRFGERIAFSFGDERELSFAETDDLAGRFAQGLAERGIGADDRVVLYLPNGWEWVVAYHAIARLGAVVVPVNILASRQELEFVIQDCGARAVICPDDRDFDQRADADAIVIRQTAMREIPAHAYLPPAPREPSDLFTIAYTSGTTGKPKGAMLTHGNIFASMAGTATTHVRHSGDVALSTLPFAHVYGNIVMNAVFLTGMRLIAPARFDAGAVMARIAREQVTLFEGVPTMYYQMLAHPDLAAADFSSLTRCTVGGQTMPLAKLAAVAERIGCPLLELWGMTELGGPAVTHSPYFPPRHGTVGLPAPACQIKIVSLEDGGEMPTGSAGELLVRGPQVMQGYWRQPDATAAAINPEGWFATGDVGVIDADGYLSIVDRKKDMIITAGYNIYPAEIEQVVARHAAVAMVAVAGIADAEKGELAHAFVVLHEGKTLDEAELVQFCRNHLAAYKLPRAVHFVADLPKTSSGKLMRRALGEMLAQKPGG